jgi:hypothetical protein
MRFAEIPGANIKEFLVTILSEAKRLQTQCLSLKGEFWVCREGNSRIVKNSFQRAEGYLGNSPSTLDLNLSLNLLRGNEPRSMEAKGITENPRSSGNSSSFLL